MWIRLDCPNGHPVKVDGKFAGRMGRCPACGAKVRIPDTAASQDISEDAILDLLGPATSAAPVAKAPVATAPAAKAKVPAAAASAQDDIHSSRPAEGPASGGMGSAIGSTIGMSPASSPGSGSSAAALGQQTRICPSCKRKVSVRYQICPHCRMYMPITGVGGGGSTIMRGQPNISNCTHCGVRSFPGATVCNNCGEPLT